jgi:protein-disulfide isomerase
MSKSILAIWLGSLSLCFVALAGDAPVVAKGSTVVAEINGVKLTLGEFERDDASSLFQARNYYYQAERKALNEFVDQRLLEQQAKRENVTVEQLLQLHVTSTLPKDPPEETLRVYYEGVDTNEPYEAVRDKILEHLRQRRLGKARTTYIQSLRAQANVVIKVSPPRADIPLKDAPVRGLRNAPVVLVEYADYECPYCQQIHPDLTKLEAEYKGKLTFAYKDAPLPMHTHAQKAAEAAHCSGAQGKYWEYHDLLFASKQYEITDLKQHARTLNLDGAAFDKCLDSNEKAEAVKAQLAEAQRLGLSGTPSFFINGLFLSGAVDYATLRGLVEQELASVAQPKQTAKR